ncbi:MAG TPA: hypothetical protein VJQ43_04895, partial [Thermoplasmata archaeon]|nr:hypothetical protein [Thermoplasmata archaeon]
MRVRLRSNSRSWRRLRTVRNVLGPLFVTLALCLPLLPGFVGSDPATVPASTKTTWAGNGTSTLSVSGRSPGAVGLSWTASADALFTNYELYESTTGSSGPWTDLGPIAGRNSTTYYEDGLGAGTMHWWKVAVVDGLLGSTDSNVVQATLPAVASITAGQSSSSTVTLAWTNGADYSGLVGFRAYQVYEILGNGSPQVVATISDVAQRTFAAGSLLNNSTYRFQVGTTDQCAGAA